MRTFESVADLAAAAGETIGQSDWVTITQEDVNLFADATGDHQWIHVDPERAAKGPFGKTIAHGYMTLSLLPRLQHEIYTVNGIKLAINYGLNKVRFPSPVPVGSRVRAHEPRWSVSKTSAMGPCRRSCRPPSRSTDRPSRRAWPKASFATFRSAAEQT